MKRAIVSSPIQASLVAWMARSGEGTDAALRKGALPLPVHYYSPVPDLEDLRRRKIWSRRSELAGINFAPEAQIEYLRDLGARFGRECSWPPEQSDDPAAFYTENGFFSFGCAAAAHSVIRDRRPNRLIEIGSGMSSLILSAALAANEREDANAAAYTVIDPFPSPKLDSLPGMSVTVRAQRVEDVELGFFDQLESGDILFVDSGHVVRIGGDVNALVLDVLPKLKPGVLVHFHDIGLPFEYPEAYATNPAFRMLWTEAYLLQAFLACNPSFEVCLGMAYLTHDHPDAVREAFPFYDPARHKATSGSFWIRRL